MPSVANRFPHGHNSPGGSVTRLQFSEESHEKNRQRKHCNVGTMLNTQSILDGRMFGQKNYTAAELFLVEGYSGMKESRRAGKYPGECQDPADRGGAAPDRPRHRLGQIRRGAK